jgi:soluble lytic murein transglycosylase-like protein
MRARLLSPAVLVCCLSTPFVAPAQTPAPGGRAPREEAPRQTTEVEIAPASDTRVFDAPAPAEVFAAVGEAPKPEPEAARPAGAIDPTRTAETLTNAVLNANGGWDPTLGRLTTGDPLVDGYIVQSAARHGVDPKLIYAVMHQESAFKRNAVSHKGASGYMQLMPGTARRFGVTNIFDPKQNIDAGTKYLRFLLDLFNNDVELALAGYNAGEYRVIREGYRVPRIRETQNYVKVITARYFGRTHAKRNFVVTYGKPSISEREREEIRLAAYGTTDDRGTDSLSNIY